MRTISSAIIGIITCFVLIYAIEMIGMNLFPVKVKINPKNYNEFKALIDSIPLPALIIIIVGHGVSLFAGIYVSKKIQNKSSIPFLLVFFSYADGYNLKFSNDSASYLVQNRRHWNRNFSRIDILEDF